MPSNTGSLVVGPVSFQRQAAGRKLAPQRKEQIEGSRFVRPRPVAPFCCSTYVSIDATCPNSCRFKNNGCYAQNGINAQRMGLLDRNYNIARCLGMTPTMVSQIEADLIDRQWLDGIPQDGADGGRDLRLHVGGDVPTRAGLKILTECARRWLARGGGTVWTYTHNWRVLDSCDWYPIIVLASVETPEEVAEAVGHGYRACLVVKDFAECKPLRREGWKVQKCKHQTHGLTCVTCRQCCFSYADVIAIELHGRRFRGNGRRIPTT